jgi:pyruvate/2-oxoglutarate dehydrogenase complex dihydrolipoamide acyltransferase (E2) component
MAQEFHLPDIGEGLTEAEIITWYVAVGEPVGLDEPLVEVETDKAIVDIPSPYAGFVLHHGAVEGATLAVGKLLVVVGTDGERWEQTPPTPKPVQTYSPPIVGTLEDTANPTGPSGTTQALPVVRKLAKDLGVDLAGLQGTGPNGRITQQDVRASAEARPTRRVPMSRLRRTISEQLSRSWREIPHVTTFAEAAAEPLFEARARAGNPPLESLLIELICPLLKRFAEFNAVVDGETVIEHDFYDIGFAVDTPDGLLVAVIKDADRLSVDELSAEVTRLALGASKRTLNPEELRGQTFTISNIGAVGGGYGTPVIPYGTSAILSIGRADPKPVVRHGEIVVGRQLPLSLSYDHRLIDGASGRRFMSEVVAVIAAPV